MGDCSDKCNEDKKTDDRTETVGCGGRGLVMLGWSGKSHPSHWERRPSRGLQAEGTASTHMLWQDPVRIIKGNEPRTWREMRLGTAQAENIGCAGLLDQAAVWGIEGPREWKWEACQVATASPSERRYWLD